MLEKIVLAPFQKHQKKVVVFSPTVTTISGLNNRGKSTLLRALRFVALNSPSGKSVIPFDSDHAKVSLYTDGKKVVRKQGAKVNYYKITGRKKPLKSFGKGKVPEPVSALLNLGPINFQKQIDLPFWFTKTSGQLAKELNEVVNLGVIDRTLAAIAAELRRVTAARELTAERLKAAEEQFAELSWVAAFVEKGKRFLAINRSLDGKGNSLAFAELLVEKCLSARRHLDRVLNARLLLKNLLAEAEKGVQLAKRIKEAERLLSEIEKAEKVANIEIPDLSKLELVRDKGNRLAERIGEVEGLILEVTEARKKVWHLEQRRVKAEAELKSKSKGRCPLCGKKDGSPSHSHSETSMRPTKPRSPGRKKGKTGTGS